ncbi:MAG TPA: hypothetical protein VGQ83_21905 [Polyangia bacterium]|jgi:hypothetical protein
MWQRLPSGWRFRLSCLWLGAALVSCASSDGGTQYYICDACSSADGSKASCGNFDGVDTAAARTACERFFPGQVCTCRPGIALSADACGVCTGAGGGDAADWSCAWHVDSPSRAPHAAYDCADGVLYRCQTGSWELVADCSATQDSSGAPCHCVGGFDFNETRCASALGVCGGQSYETCGPNASATVSGGSWFCQ